MATALLALAAVPQAAAQGSNVATTKHNMTSSGPGPVKIAGAGQACDFCHTPHASNPIAPLWNREDPGTYYQTYDSTTLKAVVGQPTGASRLCLSCHDGTIAIGQTYNDRNAVGGRTVFIAQQDRGYIGTDLSDDHPISFVYDAALATRNPELRDPATLTRRLPLEHGLYLQCTTCHDAHDDRFGDFLRLDNRESALCVSCHRIERWATSAHARSTARLSAARSGGWDNLDASTVREAGCGSCHRPHSAGGRQRLLRHQAEEDNCLQCHDGTVAAANVMAALNEVSTHPVRHTTGVHDPTEDPASLTEHVECADCHDPHQASGTGAARAPQIKPSMQGASGVTGSGLSVDPARHEFEVCYKCHARRNPARLAVVDRYLGTNDVAEEFSPSNASSHPVEAQRGGANVPSLLQPWQASDMLYCTDCHGAADAPVSSAGRSGAGTGGLAPRRPVRPGAAAGPHGSRHRPLLTDGYTTLDGTAESPQAYALCYRCHSRQSILDDESFSLHALHLGRRPGSAMVNAPCSACHDPHGVRQYTHLINFDRNVVRRSESQGAGPTFVDLGAQRGSCTLSCHGTDHADLHYGPAGAE